MFYTGTHDQQKQTRDNSWLLTLHHHREITQLTRKNDRFFRSKNPRQLVETQKNNGAKITNKNISSLESSNFPPFFCAHFDGGLKRSRFSRTFKKLMLGLKATSNTSANSYTKSSVSPEKLSISIFMTFWVRRDTGIICHLEKFGKNVGGEY